MLYAKIDVKSNHFLFLTSLESPLNKGGSEGVWKYRWLPMSALTQAAVYGAYFLMALPAGWIIRKWGYRRGVITGLFFFGIGALMFILGSRINSFYFFVLSLFVIGCGLTCLETSANHQLC